MTGFRGDATPGWEPGDFAVVHSRALTGQIVARLQLWSRLIDPAQSGWVHVITGLDDGSIIEAEPGGAVIRPMHYDPADMWWSTGRLDPTPTDVQRAAVVAAARQAQGIGYSFADYLAIALHQWHVPAPGLRGFIESTGHEMCSALADLLQQRAGYQLFRNRWNGYVRPYDLAHLLNAPDLDSPASTGRRPM